MNKASSVSQMFVTADGDLPRETWTVHQETRVASNCSLLPGKCQLSELSLPLCSNRIIPSRMSRTSRIGWWLISRCILEILGSGRCISLKHISF